MENIDVPATLALFGFILIVIGFAATFFKKTKNKPWDSAEQAPYKIEAPATVAVEPAAAAPASVVEESPAPAVKARTKKPAVKKPAAKKTPAKKTVKKKPAAE